MNLDQKDIFICHASEDKQSVVRPLVKAFDEADISYWYDEAEIIWGDSITEKVNELQQHIEKTIKGRETSVQTSRWPPKRPVWLNRNLHENDIGVHGVPYDMYL